MEDTSTSTHEANLEVAGDEAAQDEDVEIRVRGMRVWRMMVVEEEDEGDSLLAFYVHLLGPLIDGAPH